MEPILDATQKQEFIVQKREYQSSNLLPSKSIKSAPKLILRVLTHNIWNNSSYFQERLSAIIRIIKRRSPDVACLIDVSRAAYEFISEQLDKHYVVFQVFTTEGNDAGTVLLCNRSTINIPEDSQPYYYDYPQSGRIIGAEIQHIASGFQFHIFATRLDEDPDNDHIRETQCDIIHNIVKKIDNYILLGDINIYNRGERAETKLGQVMLDTWVKIQCPTELRFTYNGKTNPIIKNSERLRNARIYYKSKRHKLIPKSMSLLGVSAISDEIQIPPSPYYGLEAIYEIKNN